MNEPFTFPENCKIVNGFTALGIGTAGAVKGVWVSLKNAKRMWAVINYRQGDGTQVTFRAQKATVVAGTDAEVHTGLMPIWANLDTATSDTLVRKTSAAIYQLDTGQKTKVLIFELDPSDLGTVAAGGEADCVRFYPSTDNIPITSAWAMTYVIEPRYPSRPATAPTVVAD